MTTKRVLLPICAECDERAHCQIPWSAALASTSDPQKRLLYAAALGCRRAKQWILTECAGGMLAGVGRAIKRLPPAAAAQVRDDLFAECCLYVLEHAERIAQRFDPKRARLNTFLGYVSHTVATRTLQSRKHGHFEKPGKGLADLAELAGSDDGEPAVATLVALLRVAMPHFDRKEQWMLAARYGLAPFEAAKSTHWIAKHLRRSEGQVRRQLAELRHRLRRILERAMEDLDDYA